MSINTCIPCSACQGLVIFIRDVLTCFRVPIPLGQTKINNIDNILLLSVSNQEVVWLHVPVNEVVVMQKLKPLNHLVCNHQRRLYRELALTEVECVLQAGTEQVHDHGIVVAFNTEPMNCGNSSC